MCFNCVLKRVFVVVYCVWYVLCCCQHGVVKHDDDDVLLYCIFFCFLSYLSALSGFYYRYTIRSVNRDSALSATLQSDIAQQ